MFLVSQKPVCEHIALGATPLRHSSSVTLRVDASFQAVEALSLAFACIFTLEAAVKMVALGPATYLQNGQNREEREEEEEEEEEDKEVVDEQFRYYLNTLTLKPKKKYES